MSVFQNPMPCAFPTCQVPSPDRRFGTIHVDIIGPLPVTKKTIPTSSPLLIDSLAGLKLSQWRMLQLSHVQEHSFIIGSQGLVFPTQFCLTEDHNLLPSFGQH